MGIECEILLLPSKEGVFRPGETVVGTVNYFIDKPTKFGSIFIGFVGKGRCQWSDTMVDTEDEATTYSNEEEYVNIHKNLFTPVDDEVLVSGTFEHPFEFLLPDDLPTSIENPICTIDYKVIVTFIKDNYFGKKKIFEAEVPVYGYVNSCFPEPLEFGFKKDLFTLTDTYNFTVKAELDRTFLTPGENFTLTLTVDNNTDAPITIKAELIKHFTYIATSLTQKIQTETFDTTKTYSEPLEEKRVTKLTLSIPTLPSLYSIQHAKILIGEYKVRVTAKVPLALPGNRAIVEVPVVIGERKGHLGVAAFGIEYESPPDYAP